MLDYLGLAHICAWGNWLASGNIYIVDLTRSAIDGEADSEYCISIEEVRILFSNLEECRIATRVINTIKN